MKQVDATWTVELEAECPHCGKTNDLLLIDEWYDAFRITTGESRQDVNYKHKCDHCKKDFEIKNIIY
jgi:hypothetical protein